MEKQTFNRAQIISSLTKIKHGHLGDYLSEALPIAKSDPNLFAHLIAWNHKNGKIKDSKMAFPPIALRGLTKDQKDLAENAIAHMALLGPRELIKSYQFSKEITNGGDNIPAKNRRIMEWAIKRYLEVRETDIKWWDKAVVSNRKAMIAIYTISHRKPSPRAQSILFDKKYPKNSIFQKIKELKNMTPLEAAGTIIEYEIPMQVAIGAVSKIKDNDILLALIENMSGNELINNTNMLKKLGVFLSPELKSAYDIAVERAKKDKKVNVYKASKAAEKVDGKTAKKLISIQREKESSLKGIEGDWLILADRSGSMQESIKIARQIASLLTSQVKGKVYLLFFNTQPFLIDVSEMKFDEIEKRTRGIYAEGGTSIGCGIDYLKDKGLIINAIVIVSDGGDNTPPYFHIAYPKYCAKMGIEPPVYLFHVDGETNRLPGFCKESDITLEEYDYGSDFDYYSLPNVVNTLKVSRYALVDEIMETPLLTFNQVFKQKGEVLC